MMHLHAVARTLLPVLVFLAVTDCATVAKAPDDRAQVMAVAQQWKQGLLANDISRVMSFYADTFTSEFGNKAAIKEIMAELGQKMVDEDGRIVLEDTDIVVNGDRASVKPVSIGTRKGAVCRSLYLAKEDGRWLIVEMGRK
jgi:ketosteroid isomerase-like protein